VNLYNRLLYIQIITIAFPFLFIISAYLFILPIRAGSLENLEPLPHLVRLDLQQILRDGVEPSPTGRILSVILDDGETVYQRAGLYDIDGEIVDEDGLHTAVALPEAGGIRMVRFRYEGSDGVAYYTIVPSRVLGFQTGTGLRLLFASVLFLLLIPGVGSWIFLRGLKRQLRGLEVAATAIAGGNLDISVDIPSDPAIGPVFQAYERMRVMLNESEEYRHRFLLAISHDLKSPLTSILGFVEVLKDQVYESPEQYRHYLDIIRDKSFLLQQRIEELLNLSRLETLDWQRNFSAIDAAEFFADIAATFAEESPVRGVEFESQLDIPAGTAIHGDRRMLYRALENLFENSVRYCPLGSRIRIAVRVEDARLVINFDDSGPGIPDSEKTKVFEHFYRGEGARSTPGTGLGLNSAQSIIQSHQGRLRLEDSPLGGVRFSIEIPAAALRAGASQ
jgi:signal transduction histidine kinase